MHKPALLRRRVAIAALFGVVAAACADTTEPADNSPNVASIRLTIASRLLTVNSLGAVSGGPAILRAFQPSAVTATFHQADGVIDTRVTAASFQLNIEMIGDPPLTFQRSSTNPFAGTLSPTAVADVVRMRVSLFDVEHGVTEFGPYEVTAVIVN